MDLSLQKGIEKQFERANNDTLSLPHPVRIKLVEALMGNSKISVIKKGVLLWKSWGLNDTEARNAVEDLASDDLLMKNFLEKFQGNPAFLEAVTKSTHSALGKDHGLLLGAMMDTRLSLCSHTILQTRDTLEQRLMLTDIGADTPSGFFRLPFKRIFVECGQTRTSPIVVHHPQSGSHVFEGAYLEEYKDSAYPGTRSMFIRLIGSPHGKRHIMDDAFITLDIRFDDENEPIETVLNRMFSESASEKAKVQMDLPDAKILGSDAQDMMVMREGLFHITKVLLYLNAVNVRTELIGEQSALKAQLAAQKSKSKRSKLESKISRSYDRILVGPPSLQIGLPTSNADGRKDVSAHWRRGHYRSQPFGKGRLERRLVFIEPFLVKANLIDASEVVNQKSYRLGPS